MKLILNGKTLEVTNCYPFRYQNGKVVLRIDMLDSEISCEELKNLIKTNTDDIIYTDAAGKTSSYSGFSYSCSITDNEDDTFSVEIVCNSEYEFQLGILKQKNAEKDALIENLTKLLNETNEKIEQLAEVTDFILMESVEVEEETEEV